MAVLCGNEKEKVPGVQAYINVSQFVEVKSKSEHFLFKSNPIESLDCEHPKNFMNEF